MAISHRWRGVTILAARLFWLSVTVCLVVAPLSAACCAGILCDGRPHAPNAEKHCHESTPLSSQSIAARATRGCDSMSSTLEAIREEFRPSTSNEAHPVVPFSSLSVPDSTVLQQASQWQFLRQTSFARFLDPLSGSVFPLRS